MFFRSSFLIVWVSFLVGNVHAIGKVSCFYNSSAHWRKAPATFTYEDLKPALPYCAYLVYGFVGIDEDTYEVKSLDPKLDTESGLNNFKNTVSLKSSSPGTKMLISVGGFQDPKPHPYFKVLETNDSRAVFIKSLVSMVKENGFDGVDLAWQFPTHEEGKNDSIQNTSVGFVKEHRTMFRYLAEELSAELKRHKRILTLTVLPLVQADEFIVFDIIKNCFEHVHLMTYDYKTPWRFPNEADFTAPLYYIKNRNENRNVEQTVNWWLKQNVPAKKLFIAIPTFGRNWRINNKADSKNMKPPVKADGIGKYSEYLGVQGTLPYFEICGLITREPNRPNIASLKKFVNMENISDSYACRQPGNYVQGIWVSFDDPEVATEKAKFAKNLQLGGIAVVDLSLDDFSLICYSLDDEHPIRFPILDAAKAPLVF